MIKISYYYEDLLKDIKEDIKENFISSEDYIFVVRSRNRKIDEYYRPIEDYYFLNDKELIAEPIENIWNKEEYSEEEWNKMLAEQQKQIEQLEKDKPFFEKMKVSDFITEMEKWNKKAQAVIFCITHALSDNPSVVYDIVA